jgi:hypothetical protein
MTTIATSHGDADAVVMPREDAEALVNSIRASLSNVERDLRRLIDGRGWTALGYDSFAAMWSERMAGLTLTTNALTAAVVATLYREIGDVDAVTRQLRGSRGVSRRKVENVAEQVDAGVPERQINPNTTSVRRHERGVPKASRVLRVDFGTSEDLEQVRAVFDAHGLDLSGELVKYARREVSRLESKGRRR